MRFAVPRPARPASSIRVARTHVAAVVGATAALLVGLSACSEPASDAPAQAVTYKIVATGENLSQISAVAYYTAPEPGKSSVRANAGTVPLTPVEGKDSALWQTETTVTQGARLEVTAAPASSKTSLSCVVLVDGNEALSATAEPGQPVTCSNQKQSN
jgi:hypothetical protein